MKRLPPLLAALLTCVAVASAGEPPPLEFEVLARFSDGETVLTDPAIGRDGALYSLVRDTPKRQRVVRISDTGKIRTIKQFNATQLTENVATSALIAGQNGEFYGLSLPGDAFGHGAIFRIQEGLPAQLVHAFTPEEGAAVGPLVAGDDGTLYGALLDSGGQRKLLYRYSLESGYSEVHRFATAPAEPDAPTEIFIGPIVAADGGVAGLRSEVITDPESRERERVYRLFEADGAYAESAPLSGFADRDPDGPARIFPTGMAVTGSGEVRITGTRFSSGDFASREAVHGEVVNGEFHITHGQLFHLNNRFSIGQERTVELLATRRATEESIVFIRPGDPIHEAAPLGVLGENGRQTLIQKDGNGRVVVPHGLIAAGYNGYLHGRAERLREDGKPGAWIIYRLRDPLAETQNRPPIAREDWLNFKRLEQPKNSPKETHEFILHPLDNDTDADGDPLTLETITQPPNGSAAIRPDGTVLLAFTSEPPADLALRYTIIDRQGGTASARIVIRKPQPARTYAGLLSSAATGEDPELLFPGLLSLKATRLGRFTGVLLFLDARYRISGQFDHENKATVRLGLSGDTASEITLQREATRVIGEAKFGGTSYSYSANEVVPAEAAKAAGRFTAFFRPSKDSAPQGTGWALMKITRAGQIKLNGELGDGVRISLGTWVTAGGAVQFYGTNRARRGLRAGVIGGPVTLIGPPPAADEPVKWWLGTEIEGPLSWHTAEQRRPNSFPREYVGPVEFSAARYARPSKGPPIPVSNGVENGVLVLTGGGLLEPYRRTGTIGKFRFFPASGGQNVGAAFNLDFGLINGHFKHPVLKTEIPFRGVFNQASNEAAGLFVAETNGVAVSGTMSLRPKGAGGGGGGSPRAAER